MLRRVVRPTGLLGLGVLLLLTTTVFALPAHTTEVQAQAQPPTWLIENRQTGQCLDTGNQTRGNPYFFACDATNPAQLWVFEDNSASGDTIRNVGSGACLDHGNTTTPGFQVYLFDCYDGDGQAFLVDIVASNENGLFVDKITQWYRPFLALDGFGTNPYLARFSPANPYQEWFLRFVR